MSERTCTAQLKGRQMSLTDDQLSAFRKAYIGDLELGKRMSELIWFYMYVLDAEFGVSPHDILSAIRKLKRVKHNRAGSSRQRSSRIFRSKACGISTSFRLTFSRATSFAVLAKMGLKNS